jgi:hypothetical protein
MRNLAYVLTAFALAFMTVNCGTFRTVKEASFSYQNVVKDRYESGLGGVIPLTLERGESFGGSITADGQYLIYTSNKLGKYDLYLRPLDKVESAPITVSATNQREPVISPDGSKVAYIDDELDPDGDLVVMPVNLSRIYKRFQEGDRNPSKTLFFGGPKYITNDEKRRVRSRENNPAWSKDGKLLAFASDMQSIEGNPFGPGSAAIQNIWIVDPGSIENARKITTKGGVMPSFSPDNQKIIYVSYEIPDSNGNIFEIDIATGKRRQITFGNPMDFNPTYSNDGKRVFFTRIARDSNQDGKIDRKDNGKIYSLPLPMNNEDVSTLEMTTLTLPSENVFDTHYSSFTGGSVLFAYSQGEDINIGMVPDTGIIPRKKSITEQLALAESYHPDKLKTGSPEEKANLYTLALNRVHLFFPDDPMEPYYTARADLQLLRWEISAGRVNAGNTIKLINRKIKEGEIFYQVLLDLARFDNKALPVGNSESLVKAKNKTEYLQKLIDNRDIPKNYLSAGRRATTAKYLKELNLKDVSELSEAQAANLQNAISHSRLIERNYFAELRSLLAAAYEESGNPVNAAKVNFELIKNHPSYYRADDIIYRSGSANIAFDIPPEFLFLLYPDDFPFNPDYDVRDDRETRREERRKRREESEKNQNSNEETENVDKSSKERTSVIDRFRRNRPTPDDWQTQLRSAISESSKYLAKKELINFFYKLRSNRQNSFIRQIHEKYPRSKYPDIHMTSGLAAAQYFSDSLDSDSSLKHLEEIKNLVPKETYWSYLEKKITADNFELNRNSEKAFEFHYLSLIEYKPEYDDDEFLTNKTRTLNYYQNQAEAARQRGDLQTAWNAYRYLNDMNMQLFQKKIERESVEKSTVEVIAQINRLGLETWRRKLPLNKEISDYYEEKLPFAQFSLNYAFIFGKAYLAARTGMLKHDEYEESGSLSQSEKKDVIIDLKSAEQGFRWAIFANPDFADSYVMLGWIYQYIDTKKETVLDSVNQTKDKDQYESVYKVYFPDHLFEQNIRIYQQSLARFENRVSANLLMSLYLNMGNNYFLLSNYSKAKANYEKFLSIIEKNPYQWDTPEQRALFFYHLGKTYYFTGQYKESIDFYEKSLAHYEQAAPISGGHPETNQLNQQKREKIMRSIAMSSDLANTPGIAKRYFNKIIEEQTTAGVQLDRSFIYMQLAKMAYDSEEFDEAYDSIKEAADYLSKEEEVPVPEFKIRVKWFGIYEPWTTILSWVYTMSYDEVYVGDNHLAFPLPTIHRQQYIASLKADILEKRGLYDRSRNSLIALKDLALKDKSKHGNETLLASYMRLGKINYILKDVQNARLSYNAAIELAQKNGDLNTRLVARKNLLTIACQQIESDAIPNSQKLTIASSESASLQNFTQNYIDEKLQAGLKAKQGSNKNLQLSDREKAQIRTEAINQLYKLILHDGTFYTYLAEIGSSMLPPAAKNPEEYIQERQKWFEPFSRALQLNSGTIPEPENPQKELSLLKKEDERLGMILGVNRGQIYKFLKLHDLARKEYTRVYERADLFSLNMLKAVSAMRMSRIVANDDETYRLLRESWQILESNQYILLEHPELYELVADRLTTFYREENKFGDAIVLQAKKRNYISLRNIEGKLRFTNPVASTHFNRYHYLSLQEYSLQTLNKKLLAERKDASEVQEKIKKIKSNKDALKTEMLKLTDQDPILRALFPDQISENTLKAVQRPYLFTLAESEFSSFLVLVEDDPRKNNTLRFSLITAPDTRTLKKQVDESHQKKITGSEMLKDYPWLKNIPQVDVVFADEYWREFPFEEIWLKPVSHTIHLYSQIAFQNNFSVSNKKILEIVPDNTSSFKTTLADYDIPGKRIIKAKTNEEWEENLTGAAIIDYETTVTGDFILEDLNPLGIKNLMLVDSAPTALLLSIKEEGRVSSKARYDFEGGMELLASSKNCSLFIVNHGSRSDGAKNIADFISGKENIVENLSWSGNPDIVKAWHENPQKTPTSATRALAAKEEEKYTLLNDKLTANRDYEAALRTLYRALDANEILNRGSYSIQKVKPLDEKLYHRKDMLLLLTGRYDISNSEWAKQFKALLQLGEKERTAREYEARVSRLLKAAQFDAALKEIRDYGEKYLTTENDWLDLISSYHFGLLVLGEKHPGEAKLPKLFNENIKRHNIKLPNTWNERLIFFIDQLSKPEEINEWVRRLYQNNELILAERYLAKTTFSEEERFAYRMALSTQVKQSPGYTSVPKPFWDFKREFFRLKDYNDANDLEAINRQVAKLLKIADTMSFKELFFDTIYNEVLHEIFDRHYGIEKTIEAIQTISVHAKTQLNKQNHLQRNAYLQMWVSASMIPEKPGSLLSEVIKITGTLSSGNEALANQLHCLGATFNPADMQAVKPFNVQGYFYDRECFQDLTFLRKINDNPDHKSSKDPRHFRIAWKLLRDTGKAEKALAQFAYYDRETVIQYGLSQKQVRGFVPLWAGEADTFIFNGSKTLIEKVTNNDTESLMKYFIKPEEVILYLPSELTSKESEKLRYVSGLIRSTTLNYTNETIKVQGWVDEFHTPLSSLTEIMMGKAKDTGTGLIAIHGDMRKRPRGKINFFHNALSTPKEFPGALGEEAVWKIVYLNGTNEGAFLTFSEEFIRQKFIKNTDVELAYLRAQKITKDMYPLAEDHAGVWLVFIPGQN